MCVIMVLEKHKGGIKMKRINMSIDNNLLEKYTKVAKEVGISRNLLFRIVLREYAEKDEGFKSILDSILD